MLASGSMAGFTSFPVHGASGNGFLAVNGLQKPFIGVLMAALAGFTTNVIRISLSRIWGAHEENQDRQGKQEDGNLLFHNIPLSFLVNS